MTGAKNVKTLGIVGVLIAVATVTAAVYPQSSPNERAAVRNEIAKLTTAQRFQIGLAKVAAVRAETGLTAEQVFWLNALKRFLEQDQAVPKTLENFRIYKRILFAPALKALGEARYLRATRATRTDLERFLGRKLAAVQPDDEAPCAVSIGGPSDDGGRQGSGRCYCLHDDTTNQCAPDACAKLDTAGNPICLMTGDVCGDYEVWPCDGACVPVMPDLPL